MPAAADRIAALTLAQLVLVTSNLPIEQALLLESFAYATLAGGEEFRRWLLLRKKRRPDDNERPALVVSDGETVVVKLNRPHRANMINAKLRADLSDLFGAIAADRRPIELYGRGRHFCAGGDTDEFGEVDFPAVGHLLRMQSHLARLTAAIAPRLTVRMQGGPP